PRTASRPKPGLDRRQASTVVWFRPSSGLAGSELRSRPGTRHSEHETADQSAAEGDDEEAHRRAELLVPVEGRERAHVGHPGRSKAPLPAILSHVTRVDTSSAG